MTARLAIDGSHGEGGGQILRSAVKFSAMLGRPIRIENIRAGRKKPGLAAQHITSIRAAGAICGAIVEGDDLGSSTLSFTPGHPVRPGGYEFDVAAAREGGSAGSACLVVQTVLLPLAMVEGESRMTVHGGTHMAWSPPFEYLRNVWLPALRKLGLDADLELRRSGWFPIGQGCIEARIMGRPRMLTATDLKDRGQLSEITGQAVAANLPAHIPQRMADRASALLADIGVPVRVEPKRLRAACAGAGIFLAAHYDNVSCGFSALGERGKSSETVAEEAVALLTSHIRSGAALDVHLGDQILVPLAMAAGPSEFSVQEASLHLETNAWLIEQFDMASVAISRAEDGTALVTVTPRPQQS
jgi:RNA 3'-terminal phosphate cyclase (ATP)